MSTLISSAVGGGKKAAPKAVGRRRPQPAQAPKAPTPVEPTEADAGAALLSPPPTQAGAESTPVPEISEPLPVLEEHPGPSGKEGEQQDHASRADAEEETVPRAELQAAQPAVSQVAKPSPANPPSPTPGKRSIEDAELQDQAPPAKRATANSPRPQESAVSAEPSQQDGTLASQPNVTSASQVSHVEEAHDQTGHNAPTEGAQLPAVAETTETDPLSQDGNATEVDAQAGASKPGPVRKRRRGAKGRAAKDQENATGEAGDQGEAENDEEEDPEAHQIDPKLLSMYDLSHDSKHGKTSEREKKMAEIDWDDVARKRREAIDKLMTERRTPGKAVAESIEGTDEDRESRPPEAAAPPTPATPSGAGVQFRIVDGQIVVDEATTTIDRQAQAEAEAQISEPVQEQTDLTTRINRTTWINDRRRDVADRVPMHKSKSDPWTYDETERLYKAISMFGTDYFTIAQMFPPKTRRQIKLKVQREEKIDPVRINKALLGEPVEVSLEYYAQATGRDVSDFTKHGTLEEANSRIAEDMKDKEEAMRAAIEQEAENERSREAYEKEQARAKNGRKKGDRKSKKKGGGGGTMGGVPVDQGELLDPQ